MVRRPLRLSLANTISIAAIGAIGLNILVGFTGQISIGHGGFLAVGAYTAGLLASRLGLPFWLTVPIASLAAAGVGALFGMPSRRLKGLYLAIATLAAQEIIIWLITRGDLIGIGDSVIVPPATILGLTLDGNTDFSFYWIVLACLAATVVFTSNLFRSRVGRAWLAIRDQDIAAHVRGSRLRRDHGEREHRAGRQTGGVEGQHRRARVLPRAERDRDAQELPRGKTL